MIERNQVNVKGKKCAGRETGQGGLELYFRFFPYALGIVAVFTYVLFTNDHLGGADSGELIGASYNWGVAHPPGYPLYVTLSKIFSLISPFESVIYTYNLFSTLCFLGSLFFMFRACKCLNIHPVAISAVGALYIFSPLNLRWMTTAEVFALHILVCSIGIWLTCRIIANGKLDRVSCLLGLVAGLGASNHHTILFLFPGFFLVYFYFWFKLDSHAKQFAELIRLVFFTLLGLSFYLQPVLSSLLQEQPVSCLGIEITSFQDLVDLFLRRIYGTFTLMTNQDENLSPFFWVVTYLKTCLYSRKGMTIIVGGLILFSIFNFLFLKRTLANLTSLIWLVGGLSFFFLVNAQNNTINLYDIIPRMYLMVNLCAAFAAVLSLNSIIVWAAAKPGAVTNVFIAAVPVVLIWFALWNWSDHAELGTVDVELHHGRDVLDACPYNSMLLLSTDTVSFSVFYLQEVEGYRKDVLSVIWPRTKVKKYRDNVLTRLESWPGLQRLKNGGLRESSQSLAISSNNLITRLMDGGVNIFTLHYLREFIFQDKESMKLVCSAQKGVLCQFAGEEKIADVKSILQENSHFIKEYITWIERVDFEKQHEIETFLLKTYMIYLKQMRKHQFSLDTLALPTDVMEKMCLLLSQKDVKDYYSIYCLGMFYYKFTNNSRLALNYLTVFLENAASRDEYHKSREHASVIVRNIKNAVAQ